MGSARHLRDWQLYYQGNRQVVVDATTAATAQKRTAAASKFKFAIKAVFPLDENTQFSVFSPP